MPIEHYQALPKQPVEQQKAQQQHYGIPYDTRPMEAYLNPGQRVDLHGGIVILNSTSHVIFIREIFLLYRGGYHISIFNQSTGANLISYFPTPMNVSYALIQMDDQCKLEPFENDSLLR